MCPVANSAQLITGDMIARARILFCLHNLSACSPLTLQQLSQDLESWQTQQNNLTPDLDDAIGNLRALLSELVKLNTNERADSVIGKLPPMFEPNKKRAPDHGG